MPARVRKPGSHTIPQNPHPTNPKAPRRAAKQTGSLQQKAPRKDTQTPSPQPSNPHPQARNQPNSTPEHRAHSVRTPRRSRASLPPAN
ncbi:uncharacterized protein K452DRAFT_285959 [Aplosporella prunicola CBS 121167]|uniref:Uncharacterized protein n=1 Tax=Aplosporella prunicola CBS 121167 TaxID=1176127 RepID=A0A6A6BIE9_9PEZI|nr:uncharacterized protein K452DRAFT_285959 [Aplosporella prunicola CBS 121167]KAF2143919.1 hypothetical protein K452DRAFT_285959 [Aplosporella prunicola CBS 121167]